MPAREIAAATWSRSRSLLVAAVIVAAVFAAYWNSRHVPLLLDDERAIAKNESIRHLWALGEVLSPPKDSGPSGRPVLNLSYAFNYAIGGELVEGYHLVNTLIHALAGLALFGVARRTLQSPRLRARFTPATGGWLAAAIALLWVVHPLHTESVTYLSQRAESLMGLFYLLTLYCFLRAAEPPRPSLGWLLISLACCWLGTATKEVMVTAPVAVLLLDAIFVAGTVTAAWRARRWFYAGLAASWLLLAWLMLSLGRHSIGFEHGVSLRDCILTESRAVVHYAGLTLWPHPLVFDYGAQFVHDPLAVLPAALVLVALLGGTGLLLRRAPAAGFLGLCFFLLLAPTSSVVPVVLQPIAESRLYLPLAAIIAGLVLGAYHVIGLSTKWLVLVVALASITETVLRNEDYRDALTLWSDAVAKKPDNPRAHDHLGNALARAGRLDDAVRHYRLALQLAPDDGRLHYNLAKALHDQGHTNEAIREYETSLRLEPNYADAQINLATTLAEAGQNDQAAAWLQHAVQLHPADAAAHYNLGLIQVRVGQLDASAREFQRALDLDPTLLDARDALGTALFRLGRTSEAIRSYEEVLRAKPDAAVTHHNLGNALLALDRLPEAKAHFEHALQIQPDYAPALTGLGVVELQLGEIARAADTFARALRLDPADAEVHFRLGNIFAMNGRLADALPHWQETVRLRPNDAEAHNNLALALAQNGQIPQAIQHFQAALRLRPDYERARNNLAELHARQNTPPREK